jgi:hypothetical protein
MSAVAAGGRDTLLHALVDQRGLTHGRTLRLLERRARELGIGDFVLSLRQLERWFKGEVESRPREGNCRVAEAVFGYPIEQLLAPPGTLAPPPSWAWSGQSRANLRTEDFVTWLADHSGADFGELWKAVSAGADRLEQQPRSDQASTEHRRAHVGRDQVAEAVDAYYGKPDDRTGHVPAGQKSSCRCSQPKSGPGLTYLLLGAVSRQRWHLTFRTRPRCGISGCTRPYVASRTSRSTRP